MIELFRGDCLEMMKQIPDGSIDAIITDPPYGITSYKWDSVIDLKLMWEQLNRVIKPNGVIALFGCDPFNSALRMSNVKYYKYDWIWKKSKATGYFTAKKASLRDYENISIFYKKEPTYNPQFTYGLPYKRKSGIDPYEGYGDCKRIDTVSVDGKRYPKRVLNLDVVKEKSLHPTQKPVLLMEYLIKTYTNENETVLDFTMGCGTTGVACINTNRNFIGIEKYEDYFEIAKKRIEAI